MSRWTCPRCERQFARPRQAHTCVPGGSLDESFAGRPPAQRAILDAVLAFLDDLGPVHADAVKVGVFLKSDRKLAEIRPRTRSLSLDIVLPRRIEHPRVSRHVTISPTRIAHVVSLSSVDEVDDELRAWLSEAYAAATD